MCLPALFVVTYLGKICNKSKAWELYLSWLACHFCDLLVTGSTLTFGGRVDDCSVDQSTLTRIISRLFRRRLHHMQTIICAQRRSCITGPIRKWSQNTDTVGAG